MIELLFVLFLLSGLMKFFFIYLVGNVFVVDFTLLCAVGLTAAYVFHFTRNWVGRSKFFLAQSGRSLLIAFGMLYLWMIVSLLWSHSPGYCYVKVFMFLTDLLAVAVPFVFRGFNPQRFFRWFAYVGSGLGYVYSALMPRFWSGYIKHAYDSDFVGKYQDVGYLAGLIILVLLFASPQMKRWLRFGLLGLNIWTLMLSAARGAILFLGLVLAAKGAVIAYRFLKTKWEFNSKNILYVLFGTGALAAGIYYMMGKYSALMERTVRKLLLVFDPSSASVAERVTQFGFTFDTIFYNARHFLFGMGIGSFGVLYDGIDERNYPHNSILETWFELGIIGVILLVFLLLLYFLKVRHDFNLLLIYIYLFMNSMKSLSLVDSRVMFGILSVLVLYIASGGQNPFCKKGFGIPKTFQEDKL